MRYLVTAKALANHETTDLVEAEAYIKDYSKPELGDMHTPMQLWVSIEDFNALKDTAEKIAKLIPNAQPYVTILEEAHACINGPRQRDYGHALDNFHRIAEMWNAYLRSRPSSSNNKIFNAFDVANVMILLKLARQMQTPKRDNLVDIAGYVGCVEQMEDEAKRRYAIAKAQQEKANAPE